MTAGGRRSRALWAGTISSVGGVSFLVNVPHLFVEEGVVTYVFGVLLPLGLAAGLVALGYHVYRSNLDTDLLPVVAVWTFAGVVGMGAVSATALVYQFAEGGVIVHAGYFVSNLLTTGGIAGGLIGRYDGRQRQQRRETELARQHYRTLLNSSPDAIFVARAENGIIVDINRSAETLLNRPADEILGMQQVDLHPTEQRDQYRRVFETHVTAGEGIVTELPDGSDVQVVTADGDRVPVGINATTFEHRDRTLVLGIFRDISERRRREAELQNRTEQLELLNRVIRHDIRNDMAVITGWTDVLSNHVDDEGEAIVDRLQGAGQHVIELTNVAREYVEIITGSATADVRAVSLGSVIQDVLTARREEYPDVEFRLDEDIDVDVKANEMLSSVFRNLLNNAVQHNDSDTPRVEISVDDDETVVVRVADNGPGIPDDQKKTVFGKGEKGLDSPGTGIGLYLVKTLVTEFGGEVWIEDNEPRGAVVNVRLRRAGNGETHSMPACSPD